MRGSMAYFAGAGTVIAAIAVGLGGGWTIANIMSPHQDKHDPTRLEQRMSATPIPFSTEADQSRAQGDHAADPRPQSSPPPVGTSVANDQPARQAESQTAKPQAAPREQASSPPEDADAKARDSDLKRLAAEKRKAERHQRRAEPPPAAPGQPPTQAAPPARQTSLPPAGSRVANDQPAKPAESQAANPQAAPREQASSSPEDANAKARDSDPRRLAAEKRKAERRQQWAERKKAQQQRDADELRDVEASMRRRDDTDGRRIVVQRDADDFAPRGDFRPSFGFPRFNLFGGFGEDRD